MDRRANRLAPASGFVPVVAVAMALAVVALVASAAPATAHALRVSSTPSAGEELGTSPTSITVTFGERPDPHLSKLRVLDSAGRAQATGPTEAVPGQPLALEVHLDPVRDGVYTVVWTTVSEVDGHLASGTFAFGVGVAPNRIASTSTTTSSPPPPLAATIGRWLLYAGLMGLVGGAAVALSCFEQPPRLSWPRLAVLAWVSAVAGAIAIALGEASVAHVGLGDLYGSTLGHELALRVAPLVMGALLVALPWLRPSRRALAVLGLAGLAAMWTDVMSSHADAATRDESLKLVEQWLHFVSAGVWIGGLLTLLVGLAAISTVARGRATRRFSTIALVSVVVLAGTGILRAIDEVGTWHALTSTTFGQAILVKSGLLLVLIGLGAANRFRSVPAVERSSRPLLTIGRIELALAVVVLVATSVLQGQAPPASVAAAAGPAPVVVSGHDFATTVRVVLEVSPGTTGFNQFDAHVTDYDTGHPIRAAVSLAFLRPDRPDLGSSTLVLHRVGDGSYVASGANLSIDGTWAVTVLVQEARSATEVDLHVTTRATPERVTVEASPGIPDLYTVTLPGDDSVQVYVDPGRPGFNEFHATYIGPDGKELPMRSFSVTAMRSGSPAAALPVRRLDRVGHFVADLAGARSGPYRFVLSGLTADAASTYRSDVTIPIR